jgi:capsule polysaccharide export protein KpsC/LpsZ
MLKIWLFQPKYIKIHPEYKQGKHVDDLALLLFDAPGFDITSHHVRPICLWDEDYNFAEIENQTGEVKINQIFINISLINCCMLQIAGWGATENMTQPDILQSISLRVLPHNECYLRKKNFFGKYLKPGRNFCVGSSGIKVILFSLPSDLLISNLLSRLKLRGTMLWG